MKNPSTIVLAATLLAVSANAQTQTNLELVLTAEKTEFQLGEPVIVYLSVTNRAEEPIRLPPEVGPEEDVYVYSIADPAGTTTPFSPGFVLERPEWITLAKDQVVRGPARIFFGGKGYTFAQPGDYKVSASYRGSTSNQLTVTVRSPAGAAEQSQASKILDHPEVGMFLMLEGSDELDDGLAQIRAMTADHPDSLLTAYLQYAEALNLSRPARNFVTGKARPAKHTEAIGILNGLKERQLPAVYQFAVYRTLAESLEATGKKAEARAALQEFEKKLDASARMKPFFTERVTQELERYK